MNESVPPRGWGKDPVTQYLDTCRTNHFATFVNKRSQVLDLVTIDGMFKKLLDGAINPRPFLPMGFFLRAHSAYMAAVGAAMAGQLYELQALLRVCLEQAGYGHFIGDDTARWERWMGRHDLGTRSQRNKWKKEFSHGNVSRSLKASDANLGEIYTTLYDRTIDYGGHPNERGVSMNSHLVNLPDGGQQWLTLYLHEDGLMLNYCLRTTAQVGLCGLRIARLIYPLRAQAVGIAYKMDEMCNRY